MVVESRRHSIVDATVVSNRSMRVRSSGRNGPATEFSATPLEISNIDAPVEIRRSDVVRAVEERHELEPDIAGSVELRS